MRYCLGLMVGNTNQVTLPLGTVTGATIAITPSFVGGSATGTEEDLPLISTHPATPTDTTLEITMPAGYDFLEVRYSLDTTGNISVKANDGSGYASQSNALEDSGVLIVGTLDHFPQVTDLGVLTEATTTAGDAGLVANVLVTKVKFTTTTTFLGGKAWLYGIPS